VLLENSAETARTRHFAAVDWRKTDWLRYFLFATAAYKCSDLRGLRIPILRHLSPLEKIYTSAEYYDKPTNQGTKNWECSKNNVGI
jgi:hypothetical protein